MSVVNKNLQFAPICKFMKMLGKQDFAHGSPILGHELMADFVSVGNVQAQFGWLSTLPIAAAIFHHDTVITRLIAKNNLFDMLAFGPER